MIDDGEMMPNGMALFEIYPILYIEGRRNFFIFGISWIALNDWLVYRIASTDTQLAWLQALKGWFFIGLATVVIYVLIYTRDHRIEHSHQRLEIALEQLQVLNRVFRHIFETN